MSASTIVVAGSALLDDILDATFPLWHDGLTRGAYARLNDAQRRTAWGRDRLQRLALVDGGGRLLSTLKRYRHAATLHGRAIRLCGIGAVFTPPALRGRGYAGHLVNRVIDTERQDGASMAILFSEIGDGFYRRLGFEPVPVHEVTLTVQRGRGAPAMLVRAGDTHDLPAMTAMHETRTIGVPFSLRRQPDVIQFALARKRLLAGLGPPHARQVEFLVAEEGASAVAYVVLTANAYGWTLEEAGDRDPAGARLGALLQAALARDPSQPPAVLRTWWPRPFPLPPQVKAGRPSTPRVLFMARSLDGTPVPSGVDDVFYWHSDVF